MRRLCLIALAAAVTAVNLMVLSDLRRRPICRLSRRSPGSPPEPATPAICAVARTVVVKTVLRGTELPVDGLMVQLISHKTSIRTTVYTNERGQFEFPKLESGDYVLRVPRPMEFRRYREGSGPDRRRDEAARHRDGADHQRPVPAADQRHPGTAERGGVARQHAGHRPGETAVHQLVHQQLSRRRSSLHAEVQSVRLGQDRRPHDQLHPPDPDECIRPEGPERQRQGHRGLAWESSESRLRIPRDRTVPPSDGRGHPRDCDRVRAALYARPHSRRRRRCARQCLVQRQQKPVRRECWIRRPAR